MGRDRALKTHYPVEPPNGPSQYSLPAQRPAQLSLSLLVSGLNRRDALKGMTAVSLALATGAYGAPKESAPSSRSISHGRDLIRRENAKPGTRDWILTKTDIDDKEPVALWRSPRIEGYCSATSVSAGDTLKIMVSTNPLSEFSLEIFRTGYYGGSGGRLIKRFDSIQGKTQADPPIGENRLRECTWEPSVEFAISDDWLSGVYLGKLTAKEGGVQSYVIFTVRDDRPCNLLFQCSDTTWACYNSWPTNEWSLYHNDANGYTGHLTASFSARADRRRSASIVSTIPPFACR